MRRSDMIDPRYDFPGKVDVKPSARELLDRLSTRHRELLRELVGLMDESAKRHSVPVNRTEVVAHQDPEEHTERLEIRQWVRLPHERAMDHWAMVGRDIDDWVNSLPAIDAEAISEWTAFAVYPDRNDAAA
jgi:hypothetical protein